MDKYVLKLYITGQSARSRQAVINLRRICEEALSGKYELVIIDVLERPYLAEQERILATPTLILESPLPVRRIVGDLSDKSKVLTALNLGNAYIES